MNSFSDRGKRLKLQQFLVKKADSLYCKSNLIRTIDPIEQEPGDQGSMLKLIILNIKIIIGFRNLKFIIFILFLEFYATMPGLDSFVAMEKSQRIRNFLEVY